MNKKEITVEDIFSITPSAMRFIIFDKKTDIRNTAAMSKEHIKKYFPEYLNRKVVNIGPNGATNDFGFIELSYSVLGLIIS